MQCSAAKNHLITNAVLNITSDVMIILIPMPLLFQVQLPRKNKAVLIGIFAIGVFNVRLVQHTFTDIRKLTLSIQIVAAALNKYYSFTHPFGTEWTEWYLRESYTAMLCANLPLAYPLVQRIFNLSNWSVHSYDGHYPSGSHSHPRTTMRSGLRTHRKSTVPHAHGGISKTVSVNVVGEQLGRSESEERICGAGMGKDGTIAWVEAREMAIEMELRDGGSDGSRSVKSA
jgi:hypothetical protein